MRFIVIIIGMFALAAGTASAADNGLYLGAAVTQTRIDALTTSINLNDTSYKFIAGFRPIDSFAVELNYTDLGSGGAALGPGSASADATAAAAYLVGFFKLPFVDLYGKLGAMRWESKSQLLGGGTPTSLKADGTELAFGAGVQARFGSLAARLEYEKFDIGNSGGADLVSLGLTWTLL